MIWTHVSELAIDRMLAGELAAPDRAALQDHAADCSRCRSMLDAALATRRAFAADPPPLAIMRPRRRALATAAGTLAVAAVAAAIVVARPRDDDAIRTKGGAIVGYFVAHGGGVRRGAITEVVHPGDRLELVTTSLEPAWFAAVAQDARGARSTYAALRPIAPGRDRAVPGALELDDALGRQTVTAVFCAGPFDPAALDLTEPPAGCAYDRFTLQVEAR
jgi:hypothetical protein